jgi:hypothetical protein
MMMKSKKEIEGIFIQFQKEKKRYVKEIFESIIGCKHPLIASGATPIGSAGREPNEAKASKRSQKEEKAISLSLYSKKIDYSLGGYSHQEHWSCTQ